MHVDAINKLYVFKMAERSVKYRVKFQAPTKMIQ